MLGIIILILVLILVSAWIGYRAYNKRKEKEEEKLSRQQRRDIYRNLLKSDKWRSRRKEILDRDNHKCCWCGSSKYLQVHHRYYELYPDDSFVEHWDYPDNALMTFCKECHEKAHKLY
jgi:5-methylcytosine-specific restriction endonuclease McrA